MAARPFTISVMNPVDIDITVFSYWLNGYSPSDAAKERQKKEPKEFHCFFGLDYSQLLISETEEMYSLFRSIEPYLQSPPTFINQSVFQISPPIRYKLIELYYTFDETVVREFLGKKLSGKNRRDLDDVSEKTKVSLKSCKRQFDNIKQVLKVVDDYEGSLVENVKVHFHLPEELSQNYASIVFLCHNRFETGKKKLSHCSVGDFTKCANLMIERWSSGSLGSHRQVDDDLELDRYFLQELHDIKLNLIDRVWIEYHQKLVLRDLKRKHIPQWLMRSVESNFKHLSRTLTTIASSLIHNKDLKDYFIDIMEKVIEPLMQQKWSTEDIDVVLSSIAETFSDCETGHLKHYGRAKISLPRWSETYLRFLDVFKQCVLVLYHH
ncbi:PREDICTED: acidic fibroblast growth factor intracellular-binding protein-like [Amphimedon queenslandica]|uniref:Acidic fibroblast growth factor intracellular-binding protein n=1 Tax=Amphimedon queenslandica TaxID=400682 RepID=A0A1X7TX17_AMPQE|nr:PREDICTED: acidic fibroblast growth factor intracellular-binding protein-like [Amphimedon queenslandica]|eukprot:XP_011406579.1 PREDICTED: acidic fibroblast growth factor intracellular-binding protein-like [Amphimedon queenslandica]